jgi:ribosomal 30S subunit maturation factor RimM
VQGEVVVSLVTNRTERLVPGSVLTVGDEELRVAEARPFGDRWLVVFEGVESRGRAEELRGRVLRATPIDDPDAWWVHELVGSQVVDTSGQRLGTVVSVVASPVSDLLELADGALIPLRFALGRSPGRVVVDVPAGLLD